MTSNLLRISVLKGLVPMPMPIVVVVSRGLPKNPNIDGAWIVDTTKIQPLVPSGATGIQAPEERE
jgi:hypothetical protein